MTLETGDKMIKILTQHKPNYAAPRNLAAFLTHLDFLLRLDKRNPQLVLDVFAWAVADHFWADKMFKPNPAKYLREKFDQLEMKMNSKPPESQRDRRFAPSSDMKRTAQEWEKMKARAL